MKHYLKKKKLIEETKYYLKSNSVIDSELCTSRNQGRLWVVDTMFNGKLCIYMVLFLWCKETERWYSSIKDELECLVAIDCPKRFFDYEYDSEDICESWREEVLEFHEEIRKLTKI